MVGGHFAFLALERACGGDAVRNLEFLDEEPAKEFGRLIVGDAGEVEKQEL